MMDRTTFGRSNSDAQQIRVDRFVAPRNAVAEARRRRSWHGSCDERPNSSDNSFIQQFKAKKYKSYLEKAFDLTPQNTRNPKHLGRPWPCIPRKKCYLSSADSILDLPTYSNATFPEIVDWNIDNIMVAALGKKYHKWSWSSQNRIGHGLTSHRIQCCKFDPRGELLLLGTDMETVEIHDNSINKVVANSVCPCFDDCSHYCSITAADWSPTGNSFATGCSWGVVVSFTRDAKYTRLRRVVKGAILFVRVSPDARHLAVAALNSDSVLLLTWPTLDISSQIYSDSNIRAISWHPWRSALLGIGSVTSDLKPRIALWNVPTCKVMETYLGNERQSLDAMLFSHKTGELVFSLWCSDTAILSPKSCSHLVVMSDPDTIVDVWGEGRSGLGRVRTMVFSPDGTKLATATSDEDLIIWNFLPEDTEKDVKKITKRKQFYALPVYLDKANQGFSLR